MTEKLTPERAVRLLRAKGAELEAQVLRTRPLDDLANLAADIALIAQLLADFMEYVDPPPLPLATQQRLNPQGYLSSILDVTEFDVGSKEEADYVAALKAECDAYLGQRQEGHEHNYDRILFGGGLACTICDAVQPEMRADDE